ncbi:flagellar hook-associated family protein [Lichenibacterium dinghuense]|uniref:flagellar hook-associated family protein n=1 Tax=Lichenibacterium dinghuense TaxID=2895977 RepID=UPI001F01360D|nr:flagellar hook-associated family protein [Lichenibacterium sp. 6Y81]
MTTSMTSISSYALTASPRLTVMQAQAALSKAQVELSSGKLADIGLGLGSSTGTYVSLGAQASRLQSIKDSNATTATTLTAATTGLDALRTTASAFLASLTQAASAGSTQGALVTTASANLDALTSTLNTTVGGNAIFAGIDSADPPMTAYTAGSPAQTAVSGSYAATFNGQDPSTITQAQMQSYLGGSFANLFTAAQYEQTWSTASDTVATAQISTTETVATSVSANADPFRQLAQAYTMVKEYGGSDMGSGAAKAVIASATQLVSTALAGLTSLEAGVGQSQSAVSDANDRMTTQIGYLSTQSSDLVGVDPSALATRISGLQTQIQASYEITSQLQQLSLVNYLK